MNAPTRRPLPVWFLNAEGRKAVSDRAKALGTYLWARRQVREATTPRGAP